MLRALVLEQAVAGEIEKAPDQPDESRVRDLQLVLAPALADEGEEQGAPGDLDVLLEERRGAVGIVAAGVFLVADPDRRLVHQPDDPGGHPLPREGGAPQVPVDLPAELRERKAEGPHAPELRLTAQRGPGVGVPVLLAPRRIPTGGLEVAVGIGADPNLHPGRRDRQGSDAPEGLFVPHGLAVGSRIPPARSATPSTDPGIFVADVDQPWRSVGDGRGIGDQRPGHARSDG